MEKGKLRVKKEGGREGTRIVSEGTSLTFPWCLAYEKDDGKVEELTK